MDNLEQIKQKIQEYQNKTAVTQDLKAFLTLVLTYIKTAKEEFSSLSSEQLGTIKEAVDYIETQKKVLLEDVTHETQVKTDEMKSLIAEVKDFLVEVKKIKATPGKDAEPVDYERIIGSVLEQIPVPEIPEIPEIEEKTPDELIKDINEATTLIQKDKVEGLLDIERMAKLNTPGGSSTTFVNGKIAKNINFTGATVTYNGDNANVTVIGGGGGTWGSITGTLSDQTDLQSALDAKLAITTAATTYVPYTGATGGVDLGANSITAGDFVVGSSVALNDGATLDFYSDTGITQVGGILVDSANQYSLLNVTNSLSAIIDVSAIDTADKTITVPNRSLTLDNITTSTTTNGTGFLKGNGSVISFDNSTYLTTGDAASTYQPLDADLTTIAGLSSADGNFIVGSATGWVVESGSTARASLGLTIGTDVQAYDADLTTWAGITPGTGVGTALAVNVGSAGAFVVNGGALGTPSSGTGTNITGIPTANILAGSFIAGAFDFGGSTSLEIPNGAGGTTVDAAGEICVDTTSKTVNFYDGAAEKVLTPVMSKSITIESPTSSEDLSMFYTDDAITVTKIVFVITGSTSVTTTIRHSTDRSATGNEVVTGGTTANSTTTGNVVTSFNDATIPADSFVWLETTALSGTPTSLNVTIFYTQDA